MSTTIIQANINEDIKLEATEVLASMGLTLSDAFRLLITKIAQDKRLPFDPLIPNDETIEAMNASRRGEVEQTSLTELQAFLHESD
jgi:DNA-damage-inducible protein J